MFRQARPRSPGPVFGNVTDCVRFGLGTAWPGKSEDQSKRRFRAWPKRERRQAWFPGPAGDTSISASSAALRCDRYRKAGGREGRGLPRPLV